MDERDKRWWLQPLSYGYVGPQVAPTGLLQQQTVPVTEPAIGLAQAALPSYEVPAYQPVSAPFAQPQWNTDAVALPATAVNALEGQAIAAYEALPATTPMAEPTVTIGLASQPVDAVTQINDLPVAEITAYSPMYSHQNALPESLAATDPNLQGLTPFSTASTSMTPAQINAGMADVELPFFERFPLAQQAMSQGEYDAVEHIDAIYGGASQESKKGTTGRMLWKDLAEDLPNWAISTVMKSGIPFSDFAGDDIETATRAESIKDALNNIVVMDAKKSGVPKDDLIASVLSGANTLIHTDANQLTAAEDYVSKGGKLDKDDARQMAFQVDEFVDLVPATTPSTISKVSRPSTKKAAIGTKKNALEEKEKARMRELARQQELAKQVYAQLMSGRDRGEPSAREVQAAMDRATQVDSFSDRSGEVRAAMRDVGYGGSNWT